MASSAEDQNKPIIGYPSHASQVATGYPQAAQPVNDAYFYPSPPPSPYFSPATAAHSRHRRPNHSSALCRVTVAVFSAFFIIGVTLFAIWLVVRPSLPEFRVTAAAVSPLTSTASGLNATWDLSILVTNPNTKLKIFYDRIDASIFYGDGVLLSQTELPSFYQTKRIESLIHARLAAVEANVGEGLMKAISEDKRNGSVNFGLRLLSLVRFQNGGWWTRRHVMRVFCFGVKIGFSQSNGTGSLLKPSVGCRVSL